MVRSENTALRAPAAGAVYNDENSEWELGTKNAGGQPIGAWRFWRDDGTLACECTYDGDGTILRMTRHHPDGTYAQRVLYTAGKEDGIAYYQRSRAPSPEEPIPPQAPENLFRMEYTWKAGEVESTRYWDENDDPIDHHGNILEPVRRGDIPEQATFDPETREWHLESFDDAGRADGVARWWRSSGRLIEEHLDRHGVPVYHRRFHPNGEVAFERLFSESGHPVSNTRFDTDTRTDITFPRGGLDASIVKTHYAYDAHGFLLEWAGWDRDGKEVVRQTPQRGFDGQVEQGTWSSLEEASAEWNTKGAAFYTALNTFIGRHYVDADEQGGEAEDQEGEAGEHPSDERAHMERYVLGAIEALNANGEHARARELFRPSFEPIGSDVWEQLGRPIRQVRAIGDALLIQVEDQVYRVVGDQIHLEPELVGFAVSRNRRFTARGYPDRIEVVQGIDGPIVGTLRYPTSWGTALETYPTLDRSGLATRAALGIQEWRVANDGSFVVLATTRGIFLLTRDHTHLCFPEEQVLHALVAESGPESFTLEVQHPHVSLSLDERTVVVSGGWGAEVGEPWVRLCVDLDGNGAPVVVRQRDSFGGPFTASHFHSDGDRCLLGLIDPPGFSFFRAPPPPESFVFTMRAERILTDSESLLENDPGTYSVRTTELQAVSELGGRFVIGMADCYLWIQGIDENTQLFAYVGCSAALGGITAVEVSADQRTIYVGTSSGAVWCLGVPEDLGRASGPNDRFLTNLNLTDQRRYLFLRTFAPMIW